MAAKVMDISNQFKKFKDFYKKIAIFSNFAIQYKNGVVIIVPDRKSADALPSECFAVWKEPCRDLYENVVIDPVNFTTEMKENDVKVKGTSVIEDCDGLHVLKDEQEVYKIRRVSTSDEPRVLQQVWTQLKVIHECIDTYPNFNLNEIDQDDVDAMISGEPLTLRLGEYCPITVARSLFPLMKKSGTKLSYGIWRFDEEHPKAYILFKEEYDTFDLYSVIACLCIRRNRSNDVT